MGMDAHAPRPFILHEANDAQLRKTPPNVAVLPWGATEAHGGHLPCGTDVIEATCIAEHAAALAFERGARPIVLPTIPFGNNAQQQDQTATIHLSTTAAAAILNDVCASLKRQHIDRLVILNGHGGNEFKPLVRDAQLAHQMLIVVADFFRQALDVHADTFEKPGDHADEMETSLIMHLRPQWVVMEQAGDGRRVPFAIKSLTGGTFWTPRPWSQSHPDTGAGDPSKATPQKGKRYFEAVCGKIADLLVDLSAAKRGQLPYF
ncbi:MAG: creatininase family protein [Planctomycetes bacterium]|nr:creatininase family protein [Planctomycetota bacterium]